MALDAVDAEVAGYFFEGFVLEVLHTGECSIGLWKGIIEKMKILPTFLKPIHLVLLLVIIFLITFSISKQKDLTAEQKFWRYFELHQDFYYSYSNSNFSPENSKKLNDLEDQLKLVNEGLSYELLPVENDGRRGIDITPNGSPSLLLLTNSLVSHAPEFSKWHVYAFRQRKNNVSIYNQTKGNSLVGTNNVFFTYATSTQFDLKLYIDGYVQSKDSEYAYKYLLDNVIGEENRLRKIWIVSVMPLTDTPNSEKLLPIMELRKIIDDAGPCGAIPKEHCLE